MFYLDDEENNENNENNEADEINNSIEEVGKEIDEALKGVNEEKMEEGTNSIKISNEAVATYAGIAVSEVPGVYGMAGGFSLSGKKSYTKGIKVEAGEKNTKIDVNIIVEYGARIPEVAFEIQNRVKKSVEAMTGLKVLEVNVHIQGVHPKSEKDRLVQEVIEETEEPKEENNENVEDNKESTEE